MRHLINRCFGLLAAVCMFLLLLTTGCGQSPVVGEWKGLTGEVTSTATLKSDGTGFVKLLMLPEQPVKWTERDGKVTLGNSAGNFVGTLSEDKKSMSVDLGFVTANLTKVAK